MLKVPEKYDLDLRIDGKSLNFSRNVLSEIHIIESANQGLPTADITILNDGSLVEVDPLIDGSTIDIALTIRTFGEVKENVMQFRLFSHEIAEAQEGYLIAMHCVLDVQDLLRASIESIEGSAFEVFNTVASRNSMNVILDSSTDSQVWVRPGIRGHVWLSDIANHAYSSENSVYVNAVRRDKTLLFLNLNRQAAKKATWQFHPKRESKGTSINEEDVLYKYSEFSNQSGFLNTIYGYGRTLSHFDAITGDRKSNQPVSFVKRVNNLQVGVGREKPQRYDSLGYDAGNVHSKYHLAYAQNLRLKSFYSTTVKVISDFPRPINLLEKASLNLYSESSEKTQQTYSGDYFVAKIVTSLDQHGITAVYSLLREGDNARNNTKVK